MTRIKEVVLCSCGGTMERSKFRGLIRYQHSKPFNRLHHHEFTYDDEGTSYLD